MSICVIGGGASGLMAAITAAKSSDHKVFIIEKNDTTGKKLRATGNGKCNLTNTDFSADYYNSDSAGLVLGVFSDFTLEDTLDFFAEKGLLLKNLNGTGVYPASEQAGAVCDILRNEAKRLGVSIITGVLAERIIPLGAGGYKIKYRELIAGKNSIDLKSIVFDRVILACGSAAGITGKEKALYNTEELIRNLNIKYQSFYPVLTGFICEGTIWETLKGSRAKGKISVVSKSSGSCFTETGEIQFTDYGLSGICIFQLCRKISRSHYLNNIPLGDFSCEIDFLADAYINSKGSIEDFVLKRRESLSLDKAESLFKGIVNKKLCDAACKMAGLFPERSLEGASDESILKVLHILRHFPFKIKKIRETETAQVCGGGVLLGFLEKKLEVKGLPGLFVCGEMANADGPCGGYNLQWAWSSGYVAGMAAAGALEQGL